MPEENNDLIFQSNKIRNDILDLVGQLNVVNEYLSKNPYDENMLSKRASIKEKINKLKYKRSVYKCRVPSKPYQE